DDETSTASLQKFEPGRDLGSHRTLPELSSLEKAGQFSSDTWASQRSPRFPKAIAAPGTSVTIASVSTPRSLPTREAARSLSITASTPSYVPSGFRTTGIPPPPATTGIHRAPR